MLKKLLQFWKWTSWFSILHGHIMSSILNANCCKTNSRLHHQKIYCVPQFCLTPIVANEMFVCSRSSLWSDMAPEPHGSEGVQIRRGSRASEMSTSLADLWRNDTTKVGKPHDSYAFRHNNSPDDPLSIWLSFVFWNISAEAPQVGVFR